MHENLSLARTGLHVALAFTLPLLAWLLGQSLLIASGQGDPLRSLPPLFTSLLLLQVGAVSVSLPWLLRSASRLGHVCALLMLVVVPLPLYAIVWLTGAVPAAPLGLGLLSLVGLASLLYLWCTLCFAFTRAGHQRALALLTTQVITLASCWHYRAAWQQVLGL